MIQKGMCETKGNTDTSHKRNCVNLCFIHLFIQNLLLSSYSMMDTVHRC